MHLSDVVYALRAPPVTGWTWQLIRRSLLSSIVGAGLGILISIIVNVALVEISISPFFSLYFGVLFMGTGGIIAWRIVGIPMPDEEARIRQKIFLGLAGMVSVAGALCCVLQRSWFYSMPLIIKTPIYTLLGSSIAFALIFSAIDLINVGVGLCQMAASRSPVESAVQVALIIASALLIGCIFGCMFGLMRVTDEVSYHVRLALLKEEQLCFPIGGILGALVRNCYPMMYRPRCLQAGFANEYLRNQEDGYIQAKRQSYESDI